jgi:hypothetical protein
MILRVYSMWNQSKRILYVLLFIYVPQVIISFVIQGIYTNPNTYLSGMSQAKLQAELISHICMAPCLLLPFPLVTVVQVIDLSFCNISLSNVSLQTLWGVTALRIILGVMLLILAVIPTLKGAVLMYKATKQWEPNHYMQLFVKDGILYFIVYVCLSSPISFIIIMFSHPAN